MSKKSWFKPIGAFLLGFTLAEHTPWRAPAEQALPASPLPSRKTHVKARAPIETDAVTSNSSAPLRTEPTAERAAPAEPNDLAKIPPEKLPEKLQDQLQTLPLHVLARAFRTRSDQLDKTHVDQRFKPLITSAEPGKHLAESIFETVRENLYWRGESSLRADGKNYPFVAHLHFYDGSAFGAGSLNTESLTPGSTCWFMQIFFTDFKPADSSGASSCLSVLSQYENQPYFVFPQSAFVEKGGMETLFTRYAIGVPLLGRPARTQALTTRNQWVSGTPLRWTPSSAEEQREEEARLRSILDPANE